MPPHTLPAGAKLIGSVAGTEVYSIPDTDELLDEAEAIKERSKAGLIPQGRPSDFFDGAPGGEGSAAGPRQVLIPESVIAQMKEGGLTPLELVTKMFQKVAN